MKSRIYLLFISFLLTCSAAIAQNTGTLKGIVTDSASKETVIGAVVHDSADITIAAATDVTGAYELHLSPGRHKIICSIISMNPDTFVVNIQAGAVTERNIRLTSGSTEMQTLVVSAGKYERKLEDITVSMEVLKPTLIENKNATNITGALEQTPGLDILDGEPQIRGGSGFNFGVGSRVAVLIDGLPALPGDGGKIDWNFVPVENISQVEVIKGASSVTYGSSALSGSINIRTAYPTDVPQTQASVYYGMYSKPSIAHAAWDTTANHNMYGASFLHSQKFGQLDLVLGGMVLYDIGYIGPPPNTSLNGAAIDSNSLGEKTGRFNFDLRYRPKKAPKINFGLNGNFMYSTNNTSLIWANDSSGLYRAYPYTTTLQKQTVFYLDPFFNYTSSTGWQSSFRARYYYTNNNVTNSPSNTTNVTYGEYQCIKSFDQLGGLNVTAGLVMTQTYSRADSATVYGTFYPSSNNQLQNYAFYTQLDKKFFKVLNVSVGFRDENFEVNSEGFQSHPIFRSGLNLQVAKATFLRCSYGQGYRFPSITEKYLNSEIGGLPVFSNPNLEPESSWNAEIGIKQGFKINNFTGFIDLAAFWQQYQNTIEITYGTWGFTPGPGGTYNELNGFKYLNIGPTRVRGLELSVPAQGKLSKNWELDVLAGYTYTVPQTLAPNYVYATDSLGNKQTYTNTSTNTANNILKYRFQHIAKIDLQITYKRYSIGGDWRYYSFMQNIDTVFYVDDQIAHYGIQQYRLEHNSGTSVFDARVSADVTKIFKISFIVNNVANLSYSLRPLKIESPRVFMVKLSVKV